MKILIIREQSSGDGEIRALYFLLYFFITETALKIVYYFKKLNHKISST